MDAIDMNEERFIGLLVSRTIRRHANVCGPQHVLGPSC